MLKCLSIILLVCSSVLARSAGSQQFQNIINNSDTKSSSKEQYHNINNKSDNTNILENNFWNEFSLLYKVYQQCNKDNLSICLKIKLLAGLEKVSRQTKDLNFIDGIKFIRIESEQNNNNPELSENDIEKSLPRSLTDKEDTLNLMLFDKVLSFVRSHTLQVNFPETNEIERSLNEGRKKKEKKGQGAFIMIPLLLGGTFIPIAYGALALLAGKALIVSKLALVLASIIGIKKLLSGGGHKESQHEVVVSSGGHSGSGWGRDFDLAYSAYNPNNTSVNN